MARMEIHIAADIGCFGTEVRAAEDPERRLVMIAPAELGLSNKLAGDFRSWQSWFDGFVNLCGLEERFEYLGDGFDVIGRSLAEAVASELGADGSRHLRATGAEVSTDGKRPYPRCQRVTARPVIVPDRPLS